MARTDYAQGVYDIDEIYTGGSKDHQGHSTNLRVHVPDPWVGVIAELVGSPHFPEYKNSQDVIRDALYHRLKWATSHRDRSSDEQIKALMAITAQKARLHAADRLRGEAVAFREEIDTTMRRILADGGGQAAASWLEEMAHQIDTDVPEPYRSNLMEVIKGWMNRAQASW